MTYCPHGTPTTMNCALCGVGAPATHRSQGCDVYGSPNIKTATENFSKKCTICDSPFQSSIHMVNSANTEIRMGAHRFSTEPKEVDKLRLEVLRLTELINTPEIIDFVKAVQIEAVHQRERWGSAHDDGKTAADWFWLLGYLAGKALHSDKAGDTEKLLHHIITTAAACANWHAQVLGKCDMRPGIAKPAGEA